MRDVVGNDESGIFVDVILGGIRRELRGVAPDDLRGLGVVAGDDGGNFEVVSSSKDDGAPENLNC
jgi:hypothetical protein